MVQKPARPGMMPLAAGQGQAQACPGTQDREQYHGGGAQCPRVSISAGRQGPGKLRDPGAAGSGARGAADGPHNTRMAALAQGSSKDSPLLCTCGPWAGAGRVFRGWEDTQLIGHHPESWRQATLEKRQELSSLPSLDSILFHIC